MASLHEIQYKAWLVYESNKDVVLDMQANDTPWHYQSNEHNTLSKPHRVKVSWSRKESNASEDSGFMRMSKWPMPEERVNPDPENIWLYEWKGYERE